MQFKTARVLRLEHSPYVKPGRHKLEQVRPRHFTDIFTSSQSSEAQRPNKQGQFVIKDFHDPVTLNNDVPFGQNKINENPRPFLCTSITRCQASNEVLSPTLPRIARFCLKYQETGHISEKLHMEVGERRSGAVIVANKCCTQKCLLLVNVAVKSVCVHTS